MNTNKVYFDRFAVLNYYQQNNYATHNLIFIFEELIRLKTNINTIVLQLIDKEDDWLFSKLVTFGFSKTNETFTRGGKNFVNMIYHSNTENFNLSLINYLRNSITK
jgi:hypothetical protein